MLNFRKVLRNCLRARLLLRSLEDRTVPSLTVTNTGDAGIGSGDLGDLRYCITQANSRPGLDYIYFDKTTFGDPANAKTITLTSGAALKIRENVTITGPEIKSGTSQIAVPVTIMGTSNDQILNISTGGSAYLAWFSHLVIKGGNAKSGNGGGIYANSSAVQLDDCTVTGNTAAANGGGIASEYGTLTLRNTIVSANNSQSGGGIYAKQSSVTLTKLVDPPHVNDTCRIAENSANLDGGGISLFGCTATLTDSDVVLNQAVSGNGGGIAASSTSLTLTRASALIPGPGCRIGENSAKLDGGGIWVSNGSLNVLNARIGGDHLGSLPNLTVTPGNKALTGRGGGIWAEYTPITMTNQIAETNSTTACSLMDNSAGSDGGGIWVRHGKLTLTDTRIGLFYDFSSANVPTISGNRSTGNGGGIYAEDATVTMDNSGLPDNAEMMRNTATGNGGGICILSGSFYAKNSSIGYAQVYGAPYPPGGLAVISFGNKATGGSSHGGGVFATCAVVFESSRVDGNQAAYGGGLEISTVSGSLTMTGVGATIRYNNFEAPGGNAKLFGVEGGGIRFNQVSTAQKSSLINVELNENAVLTGSGGCVAIRGSGNIEIVNDDAVQDVITSGDARTGLGGGVYIADFGGSGSRVRIDKMLINELEGKYGGAIAVENLAAPAIVDIVDCELDTTHTDFVSVQGGGLFVKGNPATGGTVNVTRVKMRNLMSDNGGGVYLDHTNAVVTIDGCTIENNTANIDGGGITIDASPNVLLKNSLIAGNKAESGRGGGLCFPNGVNHNVSYNVQNCTITNNAAPTGGGGYVAGVKSSTDRLQFFNCTIYANSASGGASLGGGGLFLATFTDTNDLLTLDSSIIALDVAIAGGSDINGEIDKISLAKPAVTAISSLIGVSNSGNFVQLNWQNVQAGTNLLPLDPKLAILFENGGPTRSHRPVYNADPNLTSPVIDVGRNALSLLNDQRGSPYARSVRITAAKTNPIVTDIGACEHQYVAFDQYHTYAESYLSKSLDTHSRITSIVVSFTQAVKLADPPSAFDFHTLPLNPGFTVALSATLSSDAKSVTLSFLPGQIYVEGNDTYHSLVDGNYQLRVIASQIKSLDDVALDGNYDGKAGDDYATPEHGPAAIYRLFGDDVGNNRYVNVKDYNAFVAAYGYKGAVFDFDGNGTVDGTDYIAFQARYNTGLMLP